MSIEKLFAMSRSTVTLTALLILFATASGCASTTVPLDYPAQCPKPEQPDDRLMAAPCQFEVAAAGMSRVQVEAVTISNNQCARQIREFYSELQTWVRGRVQ